MSQEFPTASLDITELTSKHCRISNPSSELALVVLPRTIEIFTTDATANCNFRSFWISRLVTSIADHLKHQHIIIMISDYGSQAFLPFSLLPANLCFRLYYAQHYSLAVLRKLTWLVFVSYLMPYILCFQCLSRRFLNEFSVPANTMLDGRLFQLFITLLVKFKFKKRVPTDQ